MNSAVNSKIEEIKAIIIGLVAEYSNIFTASRRLRLLEEWINLLGRRACILFKARYVGLLCNGIVSYVSRNESFPRSDLRIFMRLHRPALVHILVLGIYHAIVSLHNLMKMYKNSRKPIYIILYATEYIPWLYLVPLYIVLKGLSRITKIRAILVHDYVDLYLVAYRYSRIEKFLYSILENVSLRISSVFYSSSSITTGYLLSRGVRMDRIIYFPPLASREFQREKSLNAMNSEKIVFVYTGNISKELSSLDLLLSALADLDEAEKRRIQVNLVLLVPKDNLRDLEDLQRLLKNKGLESVVNIKVNRPLHEVAELVSNSHIGLALLDPKHPATKQMDFPLKVAEYLCSGVPVIYTNFGMIRFFLKHGFHGLMVEYEPGSIKEAVRFILSNPGIISELASNVDKVRKRFCLHTIAHELLVETLKRFLLK